MKILTNPYFYIPVIIVIAIIAIIAYKKKKKRDSAQRQTIPPRTSQTNTYYFPDRILVGDRGNDTLKIVASPSRGN